MAQLAKADGLIPQRHGGDHPTTPRSSSRSPTASGSPPSTSPPTAAWPNRRTWAQVDDHPDGICLDADGAIWYGDVGNQRCVRVQEGGEVLQVIDLDRGCFACALGGPDRRTLFMTVNQWGGAEGMGGGPRMGQVLTAQAPARGIGWP